MSTIVHYAKQELDRYHKRMNHNFNHQISLEVSTDFMNFDESKDFLWDDAYKIDVHEGQGQILGVNARSVLLGVYKYLSLLGCMFYAPGKSGEIIVKRAQSECTVVYTGAASLRHRGICIEGSVSLENVLDIIDWAPKQGFNSYFIQFREGHTFFERWYTHEGNTVLAPQEYSIGKSRKFVARIENEIKRRGLIYHKAGHGWTCECLGYPSTGWHAVEDRIVPEEVRAYLAEVGGKRQFFQGIPLNTHLCYSNPQARNRMVQEVLDYVQKNPGIDMLHFWLADNYNNICECEACRKESITDQYVQMLNEIDEGLTKLQIETKIVFLIYQELLWPPIKVEIKNPDRFVMMFAPISRTYTKGYLDEMDVIDRQNIGEPLPYERNKIELPKQIDENLRMLFHWQKHFNKDSFVYDYHLMWDINRDFGAMELSKIIHSDIVSLRKLGLQGLVSCQVNRAFFPNGFNMYVMGRTLFDTSVSYDTVKNEYFTTVYGDDYSLALELLNGLSEKEAFQYNRGEVESYCNKHYLHMFTKTRMFLQERKERIGSVAEKYKGTNRYRAWYNLNYCVDIYIKVMGILIAKAAGTGPDVMNKHVEAFRDYISGLESDLQPDLDAFYFILILTGLFLDQKTKKQASA